jgi:hypothetical protein
VRAIGDSAAPYRTQAERRSIVAERFRVDCDCWLATSAEDGPYVVPLSFLITGADAVLATAETRPTVRNVRRIPRVALVLGGHDDAIRAYGDCAIGPLDDIAPAVRAQYVERAGWDPFAAGPPFVALVVRLEEVLCSRSPAEDSDRVVWRRGDPTPW